MHRLPHPDGLSGKDKLELQYRRAEVRHDAFNMWAKTMGGVVLLIGLWLTWQQLQDTRTQVAREADLTRENQIAGRFSSAIDYFNKGTTESRMGAIVSLEQIALTPTVPIKTAESGTPTLERLEPTAQLVAGFVRSVSRMCQEELERASAMPLRVSLPEVQAAMETLSRLNSTRTHPGNSLELTGAYLIAAQLPEADLRGAILDGARLQRANLAGAKLKGASLRGAVLEGANLQGTDLQGVIATDSTE